MRPLSPGVSLAALCLVGGLLTGCHAKFKKNAPLIDEVRVQPLTVGGPQVTLGKVYTSGEDNPLVQVAAAGVNIAQSVNEVKQERRIADAVEVGAINEGLNIGVVETLGDGPPFGTTEDAAHGDLLQIEILEYGVFVPYLGAPGEFTFTARARIYRGDGDRVYRKRLSCTGSLGDPKVLGVVMGTVNNVKQLKDMSDDEINEAFVGMARYCGEKFAIKMRKHAG